MECPKCKLVSPDNAKSCDCGYSFVSSAESKPNQPVRIGALAPYWTRFLRSLRRANLAGRKRTVIITCSTIISVVAAYLVYAGLSPVVTVTAHSEVAAVRVGDQISVNVSVKNVSRRDLALIYHVKLSEGAVVPMAFAMRDEAGNLAPETDLGQEANGHTTIRGYSSMVTVRLRRNSALSGPEKVSDLYEIRRPGKYTIEALVPVITKQLSKPTNEHDFREVKVFHSNIVTITVKE
jgi:hypothetical protein